MMSNLKDRIRIDYPSVYSRIKKWHGLGKSVRSLIMGHVGAANYAKCHVSSLLKTAKSYGRPILLNIEPTNICDQRCPVCETGAGTLGRPPRFMSFEEFKYILDQYDNSLRIIYFYFMGESFLNKDAYKMIRYAADRGIYVSACTNGNKIDPEQLVKSGIADIQFQISGTSDETHSRYRVNGKLEGVIGNVKDTLSFRSKLGDRISRTYPMNITLGMILFKHNEHEVSEFRTLADRIGVDQWQIIDPCVRTVEQAHEYLPTDKRRWIYDPKALQKGILAPKRSPINYCEYLYSAMTVQVDGNVVPCCRDVKGRWILGNVFEDDAYTIWNNKKYRSLRKSIAGNQKNLWLCKQCEGYGVPDLKI